MEAVKEIKKILLDKGKVSLPKMGDLYIESLSAKVDESLATFTPPTKRICFLQNISQEKNSDWEELTQAWKLVLAKDGEVKVDTLGTFYYKQDKITFEQEKNFFSDDFFGLEAFPLPKRKLATLQPTPKASKQWVFWVFLLVIPLCALLYYGITNRDVLFGKKSFPAISAQTSTHRIGSEENQTGQKIEPAQPLGENLKKDSISASVKTLAPMNATTTNNTTNNTKK